MQRSRRFQIVYEVLNAVTHGFGFILAVIAGVMLMIHVLSKPVTALTLTAVIIYISTVGFFYLPQRYFIRSCLPVRQKSFNFLTMQAYILLS